jgi:acyl-CoA synthetase (AMP-forming)/AMP-acid ligase II
MYSAGKDGDLRDIWRRVTGEIPLEKKASSSGTATILTVFGKEEISEHNIAALSKEIASIGKHLQDRGAKRVAVYLPNSIEFLATLFAGAFYGFSPILIPYNQSHPALIDLLRQTGADTLIAQAGSVPLSDVGKGVPGLRRVIWNVAKSSRHMEWSEVPEGIGGSIDVTVWHELLQDTTNGDASLPTSTSKAPNVVFLWQEAVSKPAEIVEFTQQVCCWSHKRMHPDTDYDRTLPPLSVRSSLLCPLHSASLLRTHSFRLTPLHLRTACV